MKSIKKLYGPYLCKDGRKRVSVHYQDGTKRSMAYAKYLMEQHLGRELDQEKETVDHKDRNPTNDVIENLQILPLVEHTKKDARYVKAVKIKCVLCGNEAEKTAKNIRGNSKKGKAGPFCGKSCAGKYSASVKSGEITELPAQPSVNSEYYYKDK